MSKQDKKELRQQIACDWLEQNYLQYDSLRHDMVTDRLQIRMRRNITRTSVRKRTRRSCCLSSLTYPPKAKASL